MMYPDFLNVGASARERIVSPAPYRVANEPRALGCDVSHWQGPVDFAAMKAAGVAFVFIKATQGTIVVDSRFHANWANAKAAGLLRGAYHYFTTAPASDQYAHFMSQFPDHVYDGELPAICDAEADGLHRGEVHTFVRDDFAGVYTRKTKWDTYPGPTDWTPDYPLWVAQYPWTYWFPGLIEAAQGSFPTLIPQEWVRWDFWQFTDRAPAQDYGAPEANYIDLNFYNGTAEDLYIAYGGQEPPPTVEEQIAELFARVERLEGFHTDPVPDKEPV